MISIEKEFAGYLKEVYRTETMGPVPLAQEKEIRRAFMGGMGIMLTLLTEAADRSQAEGEQVLRDISTQLIKQMDEFCPPQQNN